MIDDEDGHIPSPLIMFNCTTLHHALLKWEKNTGVYPKPSKPKVKADRHDCSNYFNYQITLVRPHPAAVRKLLTSPSIADTYTFLMNTWNTLPESYQQIVYYKTLATVKHQIQLAENPMPAVVSSMEAARVDNAILVDNLTSNVVLEEPEIGSTDPNIPIDNNCMDDKLLFGMPGGSGGYKDESDESDMRDGISTASQQRWPATDPERLDLGTSNVDRYEGEDGDDADADEEEQGWLADDGSTQNVEDRGQGRRCRRYKCKDEDDVDADEEE
jgi:hypothetical protein